MVSAFWNRVTGVLLTTLLGCFSGSRVFSEDAATVIIVRLDHGGRMAGQVDAESDNSHLVIRRTSSNVVIRTRVAWTAIASVVADGNTLSAEQLKERFASLASEGPCSALVGNKSLESSHRPPQQAPSALSSTLSNVVTFAPSTSHVTSSPTRQRRQKVQSLQITTQPGNWDSDEEIDGLLVQILPVDEVGRVVPVEGQIDLKLFGISRSQGGQAQTSTSPLEFPQLAAWSRSVHRADFTSDGAVYRLEFRGFRPERDVSVEAIGLLNARLVIPGQGTFAASEGLTVLRPYSPVRDLHQMFDGTRSLPLEVKN